MKITLAVFFLTFGFAYSSKPLEVTDSNFEQEVLDSDIPVLVDFWAVWCGPCRQIAPSVEAIATDYDGKIKVVKIDIDAHTNTPLQYSIRSIPTVLIFKGGEVVETVVGAVPRSKLEDKVKQHIN